MNKDVTFSNKVYFLILKLDCTEQSRDHCMFLNDAVDIFTPKPHDAQPASLKK